MWGAGLRRVALLAVLLPAATLAQVPLADTLKPTPTFSIDTTRISTAVLPTAEPSDKVTRPLALRITAAIVVLTLSTLLLYNVRSR